MGFAAELARARAGARPLCPVADQGDPDVVVAVADRLVPSGMLAAAMCNAGIFVSRQDVRDHRAADCACVVVRGI